MRRSIFDPTLVRQTQQRSFSHLRLRKAKPEKDDMLKSCRDSADQTDDEIKSTLVISQTNLFLVGDDYWSDTEEEFFLE